jgi:peptidoglycan/LPS O-acetylase OafA/YrhL
VVFGLLPYELGLVTHAYTMSLGSLILVIAGLALLFSVGFGCLLWHFNEKSYRIPSTDDHVPTLQGVKKEELRVIGRKILRRQYYLRLLALPLLIFMFGALASVPQKSPHRDLYLISIGIAGWVFLVSLIVFVIRRTKADCYKFGALCPKCAKPLYAGTSPRNGRCPNCGYELFDNATA